MLDLISLFLSAFLAATLLPAQSELLLAALLQQQEHAPWLLCIVATLGNVLGSVVNYVLGVYLLRYQHKRWFPISQTGLKKAQKHYARYGVWSLLFAWLPVIGDPLTLVAGTMRTHFGLFLVLVTVGKAARYLMIVGLFN